MYIILHFTLQAFSYFLWKVSILCLDSFLVWIFICSSTLRKGYSLSIEVPFLFCQDQLAIFVWIYFKTFCSLPLICLSLLLPAKCCLDCYSFKSWSWVMSFFWLFSFNIELAVLNLLPCHINFRISLSIYKTMFWSFDWNFVESIEQVRKNWLLTVLSLFNHVHGISLHLFRSLISFIPAFFL